MRRIGVLMPFTAGDPEAQARSTVFEQSLQQLGWTVGRNLQIDYRFSRRRGRPPFADTRRSWLRSRRT